VKRWWDRTAEEWHLSPPPPRLSYSRRERSASLSRGLGRDPVRVVLGFFVVEPGLLSSELHQVVHVARRRLRVEQVEDLVIGHRGLLRRPVLRRLDELLLDGASLVLSRELFVLAFLQVCLDGVLEMVDALLELGDRFLQVGDVLLDVLRPNVRVVRDLPSGKPPIQTSSISASSTDSAWISTRSSSSSRRSRRSSRRVFGLTGGHPRRSRRRRGRDRGPQERGRTRFPRPTRCRSRQLFVAFYSAGRVLRGRLSPGLFGDTEGTAERGVLTRTPRPSQQ
jgi:hypothetical protein